MAASMTVGFHLFAGRFSCHLYQTFWLERSIPIELLSLCIAFPFKWEGEGGGGGRRLNCLPLFQQVLCIHIFDYGNLLIETEMVKTAFWILFGLEPHSQTVSIKHNNNQY